MGTLQVVTVAVFTLSLAVHATAQSRFTQPAAPEQMRFRAMDANNDGVVTKQEWRGTDEAFRRNDWNNDGILSGEEVRTGFWTTGEDEGADSRTSRNARFDELDANRNGTIERSEWRDSADAWRWLDRNNDNVLTRGEVIGRGRRAVPRTSAESNAVGTTGQNCTSSAAEVVDDIHQQVLERSADRSSAPLTESLMAGRMTVRDIVRQLAKSPEYEERFFWQPAVAATYQRMLGREPDPSGLRTYTEMAQRQGIDAVARSIANSPEYRQRTRGSRVPADNAESFERSVQVLYRHVLGRDADPEGLRNLTAIAASDGLGAVVDRVIGSTEYEQAFGESAIPGRNVRYCGAGQ